MKIWVHLGTTESELMEVEPKEFLIFNKHPKVISQAFYIWAPLA